MKNKIEAIRTERGIRQDELAKIVKLFGITIEEVFCFEEE